jgi:hypothetical protein
MALVRFILGKFLGVVCHCFPFPLYAYLNKGRQGLENNFCMTAEPYRSNKMYGLTEFCELITTGNFFLSISMPSLT